jgi:pyridoxamine 5'-phosphate oxidase
MSIPEKLFDLLNGLPDPLPAEPFGLLAEWLADAERRKQVPNPNAMVLATTTVDHRPAARVVLCKALEAGPGNIVFFTNYDSRKGNELAAIPRAAAVFHWDHAERQARVEGRIQRTSAEESDAYFHSRPLLSRIGAWSSQQSRPLASRGDLLKQVEATLERFGLGWTNILTGSTGGKEIPRPPNWGGFRLIADRVELWQGLRGRLHDRAVWTRADPGSPWTSTRLQP